MKKHGLLALLVCILCLSACALALADDTVSADGLYSYQLNGENATLTGYLGSDTELTLPMEVDGHPVTEIGSSAFSGTVVKSVTLPETVESINSRAFQNCSSLEQIHLPESLKTIDEIAFYGCTALIEITLPQGLTYIGNSVFSGCSSLVSIAIPEGVRSISYGLFYNCKKLESITLPLTLTRIGTSAFFGCSALSAVELPHSVTDIGSSAFYGCTSLTRLTLPDALEEILDDSFEWCDSLVFRVAPGTVGERYVRALNLAYEYPEGVAAPEPTPVAEIPEGSFVLREGITWNTTPQELAEIMHAWSLDGYGEYGITTYDFEYVTVSRYNASMICIYRDGRMVVIAYEIDYLDDMPAADAYLSGALSQKYGAPLEGRELFDTNMLAIGMESVDENALQRITSVTAWQASDGTLICLASLEEDEQLNLIYLNTSRLTGEESVYRNTDGL